MEPAAPASTPAFPWRPVSPEMSSGIPSLGRCEYRASARSIGILAGEGKNAGDEPSLSLDGWSCFSLKRLKELARE